MSADVRERCPRCRVGMRVFDGRERTVCCGVWYELICPRCHLTMDVFRPRKGRRESKEQS